MRPCIVIMKQYNTSISILAKKSNGSMLFENYNDALEEIKIDFADRKKFSKNVCGGDMPPTGYSILYLDQVGTITFDEAGNIKIGAKP